MSALKLRKIRALPSTSEILPSLISTSQAREILQRRGDAREVFEQVARMRGQSEAELMAEIGAIVGLPCAEAIKRTSLETPWDSEFLTHGALPEVIDGRIVGAYCIDPYRIRHLISSDLYQSVVLVPWSLLRSFKSSKSQAPLVRMTPAKVEASSGMITLLELIHDEAKSLGCETVLLSLTTRGISYEIQMDDGEPLTGMLDGAANSYQTEIQRQAEQGDIIFLSGGTRVTLVKDELGRIKMSTVKDALLPDLASPDAESKRRKTVLLIEDDLAFSAIVSEVLGTNGYQVTSAPSIAKALSLLREGPSPDAIISDLNIADSSGRDTIAQLLASSAVKPGLVVVLSNEDEGQLEASLLRLGVRGVIPKNRDPEVLLAYLEQMLGIAKNRTEEA